MQVTLFQQLSLLPACINQFNEMEESEDKLFKRESVLRRINDYLRLNLSAPLLDHLRQIETDLKLKKVIPKERLLRLDELTRRMAFSKFEVIPEDEKDLPPLIANFDEDVEEWKEYLKEMDRIIDEAVIPKDEFYRKIKVLMSFPYRLSCFDVNLDDQHSQLCSKALVLMLDGDSPYLFADDGEEEIMTTLLDHQKWIERRFQLLYHYHQTIRLLIDTFFKISHFPIFEDKINNCVLSREEFLKCMLVEVINNGLNDELFLRNLPEIFAAQMEEIRNLSHQMVRVAKLDVRMIYDMVVGRQLAPEKQRFEREINTIVAKCLFFNNRLDDRFVWNNIFSFFINSIDNYHQDFWFYDLRRGNCPIILVTLASEDGLFYRGICGHLRFLLERENYEEAATIVKKLPTPVQKFCNLEIALLNDPAAVPDLIEQFAEQELNRVIGILLGMSNNNKNIRRELARFLLIISDSFKDFYMSPNNVTSKLFNDFILNLFRDGEYDLGSQVMALNIRSNIILTREEIFQTLFLEFVKDNDIEPLSLIDHFHMGDLMLPIIRHCLNQVDQSYMQGLVDLMHLAAEEDRIELSFEMLKEIVRYYIRLRNKEGARGTLREFIKSHRKKIPAAMREAIRKEIDDAFPPDEDMQAIRKIMEQ